MSSKVERRPEHTHWRADGTPKIGYPTREDAAEAARRIDDEDLVNGWRFLSFPAAYKCDECPDFHVGNWTSSMTKSPGHGVADF